MSRDELTHLMRNAHKLNTQVSAAPKDVQVTWGEVSEIIKSIFNTGNQIHWAKRNVKTVDEQMQPDEQEEHGILPNGLSENHAA